MGKDSTNSSACLQCDSTCKSCNGTSTNCLSCDTSTVFNRALLNGKCLASCPSGTFVTSGTGACQACASTCKECSDTSTKCTACYNSTTPYLDRDKGICLTTCPTGYTASSGWCVKKPTTSEDNTNPTSGYKVAVSVSGNSLSLARDQAVTIIASAVLIGTTGPVTSVSVQMFNYTFTLLSPAGSIASTAMTISGRQLTVNKFTLVTNTEYIFSVSAIYNGDTSVVGKTNFTLKVAARAVLQAYRNI